MKALRNLFVLGTIIVLFATGCENPASDDGDNGGGGDIDVNRSIQVTDAEGTEVGYLVSKNITGSFTILTPNGYFVDLLINGDFAFNYYPYYFTEENYSGDCYIAGEDLGHWENQPSKQFICFIIPGSAEGVRYVYEPAEQTSEIAQMGLHENVNYKSYFKTWMDYSASMDLTENIWGMRIQESTHADATMLKNLTGPLSFTVSE